MAGVELPLGGIIVEMVLTTLLELLLRDKGPPELLLVSPPVPDLAG